MDVHISIHGRQDLTGQIYRQLRSGIVDGRLAGGERLPSTRDLARQLGVSRKTTLEVFERLSAEGYLLTRPGDGTFVTDGLARMSGSVLPGHDHGNDGARDISADPDRGDAGGMGGERGLDELDAKLADSPWAQMPDALSMPPPRAPLTFDFLGGVTDKTHFPFDHWRRCVNHALRIQARTRADYRDPGGEQELRMAISRYVAFSRAVGCSWQDVIVTQGAQQALDVLARVAIRPGDKVAVENPGYPPARAALAAAGADVIGVPVDACGLIVSRLPSRVRLVYVTPSHQFPLGMPMSLERRVELLDWARRNHSLIVEDDYDGEFRFEGRPMESLKSLDRAGHVAYVGTFSKALFPELRIGYVIPPRALNPALLKAKQISDWHTCTLTQTALARFMLDGHFARHLRRVHKEYTARRKLLLAHLQGSLSNWFEPIVPVAGIHVSALLRGGVGENPLIKAAAGASIGLYGISPFYACGPATPGMLFGYGGMSAAEIDVALHRLAALLARLRRRRSQ